jgi:hypothetical protein
MALPNPGEYTKKMLKFFLQMPNLSKMGFLSSWFKTSSEDITDAEFVSIDIERSDEDAAPVLRDISTGAVTIAEDIYTNKTIRPPAYALDRPLNIYDLLKRQPGDTEYERLGEWLGKLMNRVIKAWAKMFQMLKYGIEVQASQILQTGTLSLKDDKGNVVYTLDYKPKATHFPTVSTNWSTFATATPLDDIDSLADVIRDDGLVDISNLIMGNGAFKNFLQCTQVKELADIRRYDNVIQVNPRLANLGAKYQGTISYSNYKYDIWTYNGRFKDFFTGTKSKYIEDDKVVFLPDTEDLDFRKVFGGIPQILDSLEPFRQFMPGRVTIPEIADFKARVYPDQKSETITAEIKSRPILIPVSIDRYGCLDTQI